MDHISPKSLKIKNRDAFPKCWLIIESKTDGEKYNFSGGYKMRQMFSFGQIDLFIKALIEDV